ncbi:MAG: flavin reductase family protein [Clostridia bacterium]|nr:flavin reductase family protein [Clostridia bacterium]
MQNKFKEISPEALTQNPFHMIGKTWMLITAQKGDEINTMTASWGGVGIMWNKPVAFIFVRPTRHTYSFLEQSEALSLNFLPEAYRKDLQYCGSVSGRDENKIEKCGFTVSKEQSAPYFAEADTVLLCKKHYAQMLNAEGFIHPEMDEKCYGDKNYHKLYIVEIEKVLQK